MLPVGKRRSNKGVDVGQQVGERLGGLGGPVGQQGPDVSGL